MENKDQLGVIARGRKILSYKDEIYVANLLKGWAGEERLRSIIAEYPILSHRYLHNLYLARGDQCEVDGLIMMDHKWVGIEVKNYSGYVEIDGWETRIDGEKVNNNPLARTSKMKTIVEKIIHDFNIDVELEFTIVFINPDCDVRMNCAFDIDYLTSNQLRRYFTALDTEAKDRHYSDQDYNYWWNRLSRYFYTYDGSRFDRQKFNWHNLKTGLACPSCKKVEMDVQRYKCKCKSCGKTFKKVDAVKENIIDYCILYGKNNFTTREICNYLGDSVSRKIVYEVTRNNFPNQGNYKRKHYHVANKSVTNS